jgi:hypothetical protein
MRGSGHFFENIYNKINEKFARRFVALRTYMRINVPEFVMMAVYGMFK